MLRARVSKVVRLAGMMGLLGGCQFVGPVAIDQGRDRYNHIIESTSKEQTFANILRVYRHEPTLFMDVTEVDATTTVSGSASGAVTNIGARLGTSGGTLAGQTGSIAAGATYSESPLIRYQPLLGQGLVAQMATPVSPDVIWSLYESNWGVPPVLGLSTSYLVPDYDETDAALNIMAKLDYDGALELVAEKSDVTKTKDSTKSGPIGSSGRVVLEVTNKSSSGGGTDALGVYFLSYHPHARHRDKPDTKRDQALWNLLVGLYDGTQVRSPCPSSKAPSAGVGDANGASAKEAAAKAAADAATAARAAADAAKAAADAAADVAAAARAAAGGRSAPPVSATVAAPAPAAPAPAQNSVKPTCGVRLDHLELRTMPVASNQVLASGLRTGAPTMRTYSALGILKNAVELPEPKIAFVDHAHYFDIRSVDTHPWNDSKTNPDLNFYTLLPADEMGNDEKEKDKRDYAKIGADAKVEQWLKRVCCRREPPLVYWKEGIGDDEFVKINHRLSNLRRYILIIHGDSPPADAYVAHFDHGEWYYIDGEDDVSQKNFDLLTLFMTMMAVPSTTPPLAPTITTGGG